MEALAGENVLNENDDWIPAPHDNIEIFLDREEERLLAVIRPVLFLPESQTRACN